MDKAGKKTRLIKQIIDPEITSDGAGVRLRRSIGTTKLKDVDPFLLFDHFGSDNPDDYINGFPMHPHRGIETVTYMLEGRIRHKDSVGNSGVLNPGGVQWMTAGRGIMHEEMPERTDGRLQGFQLWVNLRSDEKMQAPAYREFANVEIPQIQDTEGSVVAVIAGHFDGTEGAVKGISGGPNYFDIRIAFGAKMRHEVADGHTAFVYLYEGSLEAFVNEGGTKEVNARKMIVYEPAGEIIDLTAGDQGARLLLVSGEPIGEPIARYGPFVMNTKDEIETALRELRDGTFIK